MRAPLILLLGLAPLARAGDCNKNKHCASDEFCYSSSDSECSNRNCDCKACSSYGGKPGFSANGQNCDRYENVLSLKQITEPTRLIDVSRKPSSA